MIETEEHHKARLDKSLSDKEALCPQGKGFHTEDVKDAVKELKGNGIIHLTPDKQMEVIEIPLYKFNEILGDKLI